MAYDVDVDVNTGKSGGGGGGGGGGGARRRDARPSSASGMIASSTSGAGRRVIGSHQSLIALFGPERQKFRRRSVVSIQSSDALMRAHDDVMIIM